VVLVRRADPCQSPRVACRSGGVPLQLSHHLWATNRNHIDHCGPNAMPPDSQCRDQRSPGADSYGAGVADRADRATALDDGSAGSAGSPCWRADDLRREIVDASVGRRLDSIATLGFEGLRP